MHVRRGDFFGQYPQLELRPSELYKYSKGELTEGATLYIATDEKSKKFFGVFKKHYDVGEALRAGFLLVMNIVLPLRQHLHAIIHFLSVFG